MNGTSALAMVSGTTLGVGLWIVCLRTPFVRRTRFIERVAPQLRSLDASSRLLTSQRTPSSSLGSLGRVLQPMLAGTLGSISGLIAGRSALERRLAQTASSRSVIDFRSEQLIWSGGAFAIGSVVAVVGASAGWISPLVGVITTLALAMSGFVARDLVLSAAINKRRRRILAEFPAIADMLALAVGAGETAAGALERTARASRGELASEFARALDEAKAGTSLIPALRTMSDRIGLAPMSRFVDGLIVAIERGTPLGDVLRAQAQDVRDSAKRELMEAAGRKEIGMMVPLVFGILPLTILFAVFPGLATVALGP